MRTDCWLVAVCCAKSLFEQGRTELQFLNAVVRKHAPHITRLKQRDRLAAFWSLTMGYAHAKEMQFDAFRCDSERHVRLIFNRAKKILNGREDSRVCGSDYLLLVKQFGNVGSARIPESASPQTVPDRDSQ